MQFLKILLEELKNIFFDKDIIMVLLFGPIFLTLLFGGVYTNSYVESIPIAVLDEDNSSLSRAIIQYFNEDDRFALDYYVNSRDKLKELIDSGKAHMGVYIPPDFSKDITELKASEVLIIVDGTNIVIGNNAYAQAVSIIQTIAAGAQIKLIEAKGVLPSLAYNMAVPFNFNDRILYDSKMTYMNYLIVGFIAVFLQQVMLSGVGTSIIKNGEYFAGEKSFRKLMTKIIALSIVGVASTFISIYIIKKLFLVPVRGDLSAALILAVAFIFAISCPAIILAALVKDRLKFAQISFMLSLPTFACSGYLWTVDQLPAPLVIGTKLIWPLIYFARPFDEIIVKGLSFDMIKGNILGMIIYVSIWMPIGIWILKKRYKYV